MRCLRLSLSSRLVADDWALLTSLQWLELCLGDLAGGRQQSDGELSQLPLRLHKLPADLQHSLSSLTRLRHLRLVCSDQVLTGISALQQLTWLDLSGCRGLQEVPNMAELTQLHTLRLMECSSLQTLEHGFR